MEKVRDGYRSLDDRPYDSIYVYVDATIDYPIERVWPHALNIGGWLNEHRLVTIAGEPGRVGHFERVFPLGLSDSVPLPHYHLYGVAEVIPQKLIALEVLPEKGGSYGKTRPTMSFDSIILTDLVERTKIAFILVDVHLGKAEEDFCARRRTELAAVHAIMQRSFDNLRQLVANSG